MRQLRRVHQIVAVTASFTAGLVAGGQLRAAAAVLVLSILLLVWSLERIRDELARREIKP